MYNDDDLRQYLMTAIKMIVFFVVCLIVISFFGCASKKTTTVSEEVLDLNIDGIRKLSEDSESWKCVLSVDSASSTGSWKIVRYDTDKAFFDSLNSHWSAPIKETVEGDYKKVQKVSTDDTSASSAAFLEEENIFVDEKAFNGEVTNSSIETGDRGGFTIICILLLIIAVIFIADRIGNNG